MGISSPRLTSYLIAAFAIIANIALLAILLTLLATDVVEEQLFKVRAIVKREVVISEDMVRYYAANPVVLTRNGVPVEHDDYDDMYGDCDTEDHASDDHDDNVNDVDDDDAYLDYGSKTCPQKSPCDNPEIRDLYKDSSHGYTFTIVWYVPLNDYGNSFYDDAEKLIAGNMEAINEHYAAAGFRFESVVKKVELSGPNGTLTDFYIGKSAKCEDDLAQPCFTTVEFLDIVAPNSTWQMPGTFTVLATKLQKPNVNGFAVLPYNSLRGLLAMKYTTIGAAKTTISHELGHALGLLHVFAGVSAIKNCDDPCYEYEPDNLTGDFCNDTVPEPKNWACSTVPPYDDDHKDICDEHRNEWESINFHNLMGYARDQKCRNTFTPQQIWRMRCSVDKFIGERAGKA